MDQPGKVANPARGQLNREKILGKRHNRVHPGHFATQQGTLFYPAGMSAADWSTLVFTLPRRKMAWVHPTMATFFQNCTLILDKYPVVSQNDLGAPCCVVSPKIFPCSRACRRIWSRETGSAVPSRVSLLISILRLNLVLTYGIPPEFRVGVQ